MFCNQTIFFDFEVSNQKSRRTHVVVHCRENNHTENTTEQARELGLEGVVKGFVPPEITSMKTTEFGLAR
jgi:hypothetical protein